MFTTSANLLNTLQIDTIDQLTNKTSVNYSTMSAMFDSTDNNENNILNSIKSFFNLRNSLIILSILCFLFILITCCLLFVIIRLFKKKRSNENYIKTIGNSYPKYDQNLSTNQIASIANINPINKDIQVQPSTPITITSNSMNEMSKSKLFDKFENELKQTWNDKGISSSSNTQNQSTINDDEIETVNEVLGMEERNGKIYYKVNFTGHPVDYTAWVCEEDLIPE